MFSESTCCDLLLPYTDVQQLVNQGLLVHHVGHIWHVETVELGAVLENDVSNLGYQHTLSQPQLQVHEEPGKKKKKNLHVNITVNRNRINTEVFRSAELTSHWLL